LETGRFVQSGNFNETLPGIGAGQGRVKVAKRWFGWQRMKRKRHFHDHTLCIATDRRRKQREMIQCRLRLHFRDVFVRT
jgi:hypothetical protein